MRGETNKTKSLLLGTLFKHTSRSWASKLLETGSGDPAGHSGQQVCQGLLLSTWGEWTEITPPSSPLSNRRVCRWPCPWDGANLASLRGPTTTVHRWGQNRKQDRD